MNKAITVAAVVISVAAIAFAAPRPAATPGLESIAPVGRFTIEKESWEVPILLDTATGEMWMLQESTNLVEARMVAWTPMRRIANDAELAMWWKEAKGHEDRYLATVKSQSLAELERKRAELGPDHPDVINLAKEIAQFSPFQGVTDEQVDSAKAELRASGVDVP